jgi:hypothetical protein
LPPPHQLASKRNRKFETRTLTKSTRALERIPVECWGEDGLPGTSISSHTMAIKFNGS